MLSEGFLHLGLGVRVMLFCKKMVNVLTGLIAGIFLLLIDLIATLS